MKYIFLITALACASLNFTCLGQTKVSLVHDITPGKPGNGASNFTRIGKNIYFMASDGINGYELWRTDGTITKLVADINPGPASSYPGYLYDGKYAYDMVAVNDRLFFTANDGTHGTELWTLDLLDNPVMLADINPGNGSSIWFPALDDWHSNLVPVNSTETKLFFDADDGTGRELWCTDGTPQGTRMVKKINKQRKFSYGAAPEFLTAVNDKVYFSATDETRGRELWVSDGTEQGTKMVKNINPYVERYGSRIEDTLEGAGSDPEFLTNINGILYFSAYAGTTYSGDTPIGKGTELFTYSPISNVVNTIDLNPGLKSSNPKDFFYYNFQVYFSAEGVEGNRELYSGLYQSTALSNLKEINPEGSSNPANFCSLGNKVYFTAATTLNGIELWETDGTPIGTKLRADIREGAGSSEPKYLTAVGDYSIYFVADDGVWGRELWEIGPTGPPLLLEDIRTGSSGSYPWDLFNMDGTLYFTAESSNFGSEVFTLKGVTTGVNDSKTELEQPFPNPNAGQFTINTNKEVRIFNGQGTLIYSSKPDQNTSTIDISSHGKGVYFYQIIENNQIEGIGKILIL
jgi:ELWxxDGT repeat protein